MQLSFATRTHDKDASLSLAFIVDPLSSRKAFNDPGVALMRAAQAHGHEVYAIEAASLTWQRPEVGHGGGVYGEAVRLNLRLDDHDWYRETGRAWLPLRQFDAVLMRKDPPFDTEYLAATWLLERAEAEGARIFNRPRALRDHSEQLAIAEFNRYTVPTLVSRDLNLIQHFIDAQRDVVVKPLSSQGISQVFRIHRNDSNRNSILDTLSQQGTRTIVVQQYMQAISQGDKRILLIAGKVVPWGLARIPKAGEIRSNLAAGGTGVAQELTPREREMAEQLGPLLWKRGLLIVGLDVIGEHLKEINVTNPVGLVEIRQQTGFDAAGACVSALEHLCSSPSSSPSAA